MKITKFRIFNLFLMLLVLGTKCTSDHYELEEFSFVPQELKIEQVEGLKLASMFVQDEVAMNVKLSSEGEHRVKIYGISDKLISQEKLTANLGDNVLTVYTKILPKGSYRIELYKDENRLGVSTFFKN